MDTTISVIKPAEAGELWISVVADHGMGIREVIDTIRARGGEAWSAVQRCDVRPRKHFPAGTVGRELPGPAERERLEEWWVLDMLPA